MQEFDFILKNGHVIDPGNHIDGKMDIAVRNRKIVQVAQHIDETGAKKVLDLDGLYVTPGLVDTHVHCYFTAGLARAWAGDYSLQPDFFYFPGGVTTVVDTGSAGSYNFPHFRATVIDRAKTRIFALLNIADYGMISLQSEQFPEKNDKKAFVECVQKNKDIIKGIKIAHYWGKDWGDVECAQSLQKLVDLPIMVDFGVFRKERPFDQLVMEKLNPGDIATHCFRSTVPVVDENGKVYDYLYRARKRGVYFDLGHGAGGFLFRNGVPAMRQGFVPDSFSSDLHALNVNGTVMNMSVLLSKMLACCDMPLTDLFERVTSGPAKMLNLGNIGNLSVGTEADIAVWSIRTGNFKFKDIGNGTITGTRKLECEMTFRAGEVVWDMNARDGVPFQELPELYGFDPTTEDYVLPSR